MPSKPPLELSSLVAVGAVAIRNERGYWLVPSPTASSTTSTLLDWLMNET